MNNKELEVLNTSISQAKKYAFIGNYGRAFAHYLVYLELCKKDRKVVEDEFIDILLKWLEILKSHQRNDNILSCLQSALEYFPVNCVILTITARHLTEWNQHKTAISFLKSALKENENYLPAIKLLNYINNVLLERWHIRMLNDKIRNESFQKAIDKKISQGYNNILDIGTGTGLLSLYASKSKHPIKEITACDSSNIMIELATEIADENHSLFNLIPQRSTDMKITEKFNLIVAEIFDSGVFGEGVIETLIHAWNNLLSSNGKVIPYSVELNISGVQCNELARKHSIFTQEINNLNFTSFNIINMDSAPYETEDIFCFKNCKYIVNLITPWIANFNNVTELKKILGGEMFTLNLECSDSGIINAFVLWFKLNLDDGISINNRPSETNRNCCWEQAIFHLDQPLHVVSGDFVSISLFYKDGNLKIIPNCIYNDTLDTYRVPTSVVRFLNDSQSLEAISNIAQCLSNKYNTSIINILDLSPFPYLGLLLLKNTPGSLKCRVKTDCEKILIKKLCERDKIQCELTFIESPIDCCANDKFDVIFVNILETEGELNQTNLLHTQSLKQLLKPQGVFLPSSVTLYGTIVECDWFKRVSHVDNINVSNFQIAEFINKYENREQMDFTLRHLNYKNLTKPCELTCINLEKSTKDIVTKNLNIDVKSTGKANAVCYWFDINLMDYKHNTGPENEHSYVNNAAFLFNPEISLKENDQINLQIIEHSGLLKISLDKIKMDYK